MRDRTIGGNKMATFEVTFENCQHCQYCDTTEGRSDWKCGITDSQYETDDSIPCKQQ